MEVHLARSEGELIDLVLHRAPEPLGIRYTTWNQRARNQDPSLWKIDITSDYSDAVLTGIDALNQTIGSHPVIENMSPNGQLALPEDRILAMTDFVSLRQIREISIFREFYRHVEVVDHAAFEAWYDDDTGVMACFISTQTFSEETKLMIHLFRQHLSIAFLRFKRDAAKKKRLSLLAANPDHAPLTRREHETLPYLLAGKSNSEIATILGISPRTAEKHVASIIEKCGAENRKTLIAEAVYRT